MALIRLVHACVWVAVVLLASVPRASEAQSAQDCGTAVQGLFKTCAEAAGISMENFLWFSSNGTSPKGQAPSDPDAFKTKICAAEPQVGGCIFQQMLTLVNTTCAQSPQTITRVQELLVTYDNKCAHPCRFTLVNDLRACYTSSGLDVSLFLNNRTSGQVIGSTKQDVDDFCGKKDKLLSCMKPVHDNCPEALPIMSQLDFHLPSYEKGINILCTEPDVYLRGLECFVEPTNPVQKCLQESQQAFLQTNLEAQSKNWTQEKFVQETCRLTIKQVDCDLKAWAKKNHEACNPATIGLRREMECHLMPPKCPPAQKPLYDQACHTDKFNKAHRGQGANGGMSGMGNGNVPAGGNSAALESSASAILPPTVLFFFFATFVAVLFPR